MVVAADVEWPDIEDVLMAYLAQATGETTDTEAPEDGESGISINRVGGEDDGITDYPRVEISCYAPTRNAARQMSGTVRQDLLILGGQSVTLPDATSVYVDFCRTDVPPESVQYANPGRHRHVAFYRLGLRRPRRR